MTDQYYMKIALQEAQKALDSGEVPIGSVVVCADQVIAKGYNQTEQLQDVTAHAEIIAITAASNHIGNKYLINCTLYVTLEPCPMCAHAIRLARFKKVIFGAPDEKGGFLRIQPTILHPKTELVSGVESDACSHILHAFFESKRKP